MLLRFDGYLVLSRKGYFRLATQYILICDYPWSFQIHVQNTKHITNTSTNSESTDYKYSKINLFI